MSETRRCVKELGFKTVFMRPDIINGHQWHDPYYDPLWAECQSLDIPVGFHAGGRPSGVAQVGDREFSTGMLHHVYSHSVGMMLVAGSFCGGGIFERFPDLKAASLEGNSSWVPWLMWRLDEHYEWRGYEHPELTMFPSEYFKRQGFASVECDEWPYQVFRRCGLRPHRGLAPQTIRTQTSSTLTRWTVSWQWTCKRTPSAGTCGTTAPASTGSRPRSFRRGSI